MSRVVWFDCAAGAAGDMLLGALLDLGLPLADLEAALRGLPLDGWRLTARKVDRAGLQATKLDVHIEGHSHEGHSHEGHSHEGHSHEGHSHGGDEHAFQSGHHPHGHRSLSDILRILDASSLAPEIRDRCAGLFERLGQAEASAHGLPLEAVHFHEVGAVDSIIDIVGTVWGLAQLRADRFVASPLNVGSGTIEIAHGRYPVPPPATARLVIGAPVYGSGEGELLTPTGALLVTGHAQSYGPLPAMTVEGVGNGAGGRNLPDRPNVVRIFVGRVAAPDADERVLVLETEIDDMAGQLYGPLLDRLLAAGALDVFYTPVQMKKSRPGILVTVLAPPSAREPVEDILFRETTTLGVRRQEWQRTVLGREQRTVRTAYGPIRIKVGLRHGRICNVQPEFDDCLRAAGGQIGVKEVWAAALAAAATLHGGSQ